MTPIHSPSRHAARRRCCYGADVGLLDVIFSGGIPDEQFDYGTISNTAPRREFFQQPQRFIGEIQVFLCLIRHALFHGAYYTKKYVERSCYFYMDNVELSTQSVIQPQKESPK